MESFEAEIFLSIPSLMVLWSSWRAKGSPDLQQLCLRFCPELEFNNLQIEFD